MPRKRKAPVINEEKENESDSTAGNSNVSSSRSSMMLHGPMYTIMSNAQLNMTFHNKYIKEMKQLYAKMDHDAFMFTLIKLIKPAMEAEDNNEFARTTLLFCAQFVSSYDGEDTHPLLLDMCKWLLKTISYNPHIRYRLCQFVNMILNALGQEAALDDNICDGILEYMLERLRDISASVRVQAILAMQRLQVPDNPDDPVLRAYQFHLCSDPSPRVRQAVITCMGRNYNTIPYILDRLWDIDEKVRRHTYFHMSTYPVRSYKVSQRLTLLEQGLNDRSESVRKVVITIMLQQWIESYQKNLISLISAFKLDSSEDEIARFRKITKQALREIFKKSPNKDELIMCIPLEEEVEFHRCVPHEQLTIEISLYWQCLTEYLQAEMAEELELIVPELSVFCAYVEKFCQSQKIDMDKFEQMEFQYVLLSLMEILYTFDLGDEIGRNNLQVLLGNLLKNFTLDEKVIEIIVKCAENLITDQNVRLQYFVEIIQDICDLNVKQNELLPDRSLINELLQNSTDADLNLKLSSLKVRILELEEQEMNFFQIKDYVKAQQKTEEKNAASEEYTNMLKPLLEKKADALSLKRPLRKVVKPESILKCLQLTFHMVVSPKVISLNPSICKLYQDFICRHIASNQIIIRDWALKCGTAYSMLYETLAKEVYGELYSQFFKNHNIRIWETAITCIFQLLDRYGVDNFIVQEDQSKSKKGGRQLYSTLDYDDVTSASDGPGVIYMMSHFLDTCDDVCIVSAIISGFCRLVLRGYIKNSDIIEKLLLRYFNPATDPGINQILGVFLENILQRKKHSLLEPCLMPTITTIMGAPYESPLQDVRPETVTRFIIDATRLEGPSSNGEYTHNKLALTFLREMNNNANNKELSKLLAKEIITLQLHVEQNEQLKNEMKSLADGLIKMEFDPKTIKYIVDFKSMVDGKFNPPPKPVNNESDEDVDDDNSVQSGSRIPPVSAIQEESQKEMSSEATSSEVLINRDEGIVSDDATVTTSEEATEPNAEKAAGSTAVGAPPADGTATVIEAAATIIEAVTVSASQTLVGADKSTRLNEGAADSAAINKSNISPSALTPTTFGQHNHIGQRYLRKSLNISRNQSDSEAGDGPSRPPKIRIEARIDSDKKSTRSPSRERGRPMRAKRNLRYGSKSPVSQRENSHKSELTTRTRAREAQQHQKVTRSNKPPTQTQTQKTPTRPRSASKPKSPEPHAPPEARNLRRGGSRQRTVISPAGDNLNTSADVIAASPTVASPVPASTRLRRIFNNNARLRATRSQMNTTTEQAKISGRTPKTRKTKSLPKHTSSSPDNFSPLRKRLRADGPQSIARRRPSITRRASKETPAKSPEKAAVVEVSKTSATAKGPAQSASNNNDVSSIDMPPVRPSSSAPPSARRSRTPNRALRLAASPRRTRSRPTKETTVKSPEKRSSLSKLPAAISTGASSKTSADAAGSSSDDEEETSTDASPVRVNLSVPPATRRSKSSSQKLNTQPSNIPRPKTTANKRYVPAPNKKYRLNSSTYIQASPSSIATRNSARRERHFNSIVTRKRLSLEGGGHVVSPQQPKGKRKVRPALVSRIPVRAKPRTNAQQTSSETAISSSSSAEDQQGKKLVTKMTVLNLAGIRRFGNATARQTRANVGRLKRNA